MTLQMGWLHEGTNWPAELVQPSPIHGEARQSEPGLLEFMLTGWHCAGMLVSAC